MPGSRQLKQFSSDLLAIGDELTIRASRGEKPVRIPIPKDITIEDDSEDFVLGMPINEAVEEEEQVEEDLSDLAGLAAPQASKNENDAPAASFDAPDLSSLLNPINVPDDASAGSEMPDLSMFMEPEEEEVEAVEEEPEEVSIADMGLEALLAGGGFDEPEEQEEEEEYSPEIDMSATEDVASLDDIDNFESPKKDPVSEIDADLAAILGEDAALKPADNSGNDVSGIDDFDASLFDDNSGSNDIYSGIDIDNLDSPVEADSLGSDTANLLDGIGNLVDDIPETDDSDVEDLDELGNLDFVEDLAEASSGLDDIPANAPVSTDDFGDVADLDFATDDIDAGSVDSGDTGLIDDLGGAEEIEEIQDIDSLDSVEPIDSEDSDSIEELGDDLGIDSGDGLDGLIDDLGDSLTDDLGNAAETDAEDFAESFDLDNLGGDSGADLGELTDADADGEGTDDFSTDGMDFGADFEAPAVSETEDLGDTAGLDDLGSFDFDQAPAADEGVSEFDAADLGDLDSLGETEDFAEPADLGSDALDSVGDSDSDGNLDDVGDLSDLGAEDPGDFAEDLDSLDNDSLDNLDSIDELDGASADFNTPDAGDLDSLEPTDGTDGSADDAADGFDISDIDIDAPGSEMDSGEEDFGSGVPDGLFNQDDMEIPDSSDDFGAVDFENLDLPGDDSGNSDLGSDDFEAPADTSDSAADFGADFGGGEDFGSDFDVSDVNLDDMDGPGDFGAESLGSDVDFDETGFGDTSDDSDSEGTEETPEVFDISEMDGMDFDMPETDAQMGGGDFDLGNGDDFALEGDFEIPGFSDVETIKEEKKGSKLASGKDKGKRGKKGKDSGDVDEADFSQAMESEDLPPNTLSDAQYKEFLKNLSEYPLNVRLAVEDLLVKDEFTEDAEFEIVEKILNKVPARQLASTLEKMLDTSIPVPRDYEHRTAEEYEAYKKSLAYQLRNKIIPGAIAFVALLLVAWGLFNFSKNCIYKPLKANSLYKQGYNLIQENEYPQSEMKFTEATKYKLSKKWFFEYARGYREHKQYQRAGKMYKNILYCFKHDKTAGLEYAAMELEDLANYERAEEIIKREVLDYHINDADGILLLGDNYLEWGTEKDPEKLELARQQYATLMQLYKPNELYLSRMMRYFIRSDKLLSVLQIKDTFQKDKSLVPEDWTELSGYLLEKYYGPLAPADEYLRYQIEGLRGLLLKAVKNDSNNPVAFYNLGRYYVLSKELSGIESSLQKAIKKFNTSESLKRRDIYKYIDSYRLLGEYYIGTTDYLQAQEQFTEGISLYTTERDNAGFEGNAQVGKLFEDLANIKYFVSGDYDEALLNYKNSVELNNDSPSIRYKIGYIQYKNKNFIEALGSFMKAGDGNIKEPNLMLAMANTLSLRGDDYTAQGYYERLINKLDLEVAEKGLVLPQKNINDNDLVTSYMYASNNYGVTLYHLAKRTGNSSMNAQAIVQFQQSVRAWDALTRNQETLLRLPGSNLAEQNIQYITHRLPDFEPSIYINIPNTLTDKEHL